MNSTRKNKNVFNLSISGGAWMLTLQVFSQCITIIRTIIIARIITPKYYGILSIALLAMAIFNKLSESGFRAALIQKDKDNIDEYLNTAWSVGVIRNGILFLLLFISAPWLAQINIEPELTKLTTNIIRAVSLSFLFSGFTNIATIYFQKEMNFNKTFILNFSALLLDTFISILFVIIYESIWALVAGRLAANLLKCLMSYFMHQYRPKFSLNSKLFKELWSFGKWIFVDNILMFIIVEGNKFFIWGLLGPTSLGLYQIADKHSRVPIIEFTSKFYEIFFPAYSMIQSDVKRLQNAYLKILLFTVQLFPAIGLIYCLSFDFTHLFLDANWYPIIDVIKILSISLLFIVTGTTFGPLFHATGRPDIAFKNRIFRFTIFIVLIYPLTKQWGINGAALTFLAANVITMPIVTIYIIKNIIKCSYITFLKPIIITLAATLILAMSIYLTKSLIETMNIIWFFVLIAIGIISYIICILSFDRIFKLGLLNGIQEIYTNLKSKRNNLSD